MSEPGILTEGARRVWRRQRVVWWFFLVNLVLARMASLPFASRVSDVTDYSLHAQRLVDGFDLGSYSELAANPDAAFHARGPESAPAVFVFFVFALFLTGGILVTYGNEHRLSTSQFFEACGAHFWRLARLLLFMLIILVPLGILDLVILRPALRMIIDGAGPEATPYAIIFATLLGTALLLMAVRLWFDMAQVRAVVDDERVMRRNFVAAFRLTKSNFGSLFWMYFRISFLAWLGLAVGMWLWAHIPGRHSFVSFLLLETILVWWIATRLWQRAAEVVWYQRRVVPVPAAVEPPTAVAEPVLAPEDPYPTNQ
jgi:hypothetical protein